MTSPRWAPVGARMLCLIFSFLGFTVIVSLLEGRGEAIFKNPHPVSFGGEHRYLHAANPEAELLKTADVENKKAEVTGASVTALDGNFTSGARVLALGGANLVVLDDETYFSFIKDNPSVLVLYYALWCHWCRDFIPKYIEAARILQGQGVPALISYVDVSRNHKVADVENIKDFPVCRLVLDGIPHEYTGPREALSIVKWVSEKMGVGILVAEASQLDGIVSSHKGVAIILGWFGGLPKSNVNERTDSAIKVFEAVSRRLEHTLFLQIASFPLVEHLIAHYDAPSKIRNSTQNFILLINTHKGHYNDIPPAGGAREVDVIPMSLASPVKRDTLLFDGDITNLEQIKDFITTYRFLEVEPFTSHTAFKAFGDGRPIFLVVTSPKVDSLPSTELQKLTDVIHSAARQFRSRMIFIHCFEDPPSARRLFHILGLLDEPTPSARIFLANPNGHSAWYSVLKYRPPPELLLAPSPKGLVQYIESYFAGELEPWVHSEAPPTAEDLQGPIFPLVGSEFRKLVFDDKQRTVVVEFFAPWCGHCKQLEPVYRDVGKLLLPYREFVLYSLDATQNEVPETITGYPTILLYSRTANDENGKKLSYAYYGERSVEALLTWIVQHGNPHLSAAQLLADAAVKKNSPATPKAADEEL